MKIEEEYSCSAPLNNMFEKEFYKMSRGFLQHEGYNSVDTMKDQIDQYGTELRKTILKSLSEEYEITQDDVTAITAVSNKRFKEIVDISVKDYKEFNNNKNTWTKA